MRRMATARHRRGSRGRKRVWEGQGGGIEGGRAE